MFEGRFLLIESQYYSLGEFDFGMVFVYDRRTGEQYSFKSEDWGTMENARDAAEQGCGGWTKFVITGRKNDIYSVVPLTEGALIG